MFLSKTGARSLSFTVCHFAYIQNHGNPRNAVGCSGFESVQLMADSFGSLACQTATARKYRELSVLRNVEPREDSWYSIKSPLRT